MEHKKLLPACHSYVTASNRTDILFTVSAYAARNRYPDTSFSEDDLTSLLYAAGILRKEDPRPLLIKGVSCFSIVSDYKCSFICHFCPLSERFKNEKEAEESMLLSYSLKGWKNFQYLLKNGLTSKSFQSLFLVNPVPAGKIVATIPLLRLSFNYLEQATSPDTDFLTLPAAICNALKQNNQEKLTNNNIQTVKTFLTNLQKEYRGVSENSIQELFNRYQQGVSGSAPASLPDTVPKPVTSLPDILAEPEEFCIDGLLGKVNKKSGKQYSKSTSQSTLPDSQSKLSKDPLNLPKKDSLQFVTSYKPACTQNDETDLSTEQTESLYLPSNFSIRETEDSGYPFHVIDSGNAGDLHQFESFLLYNPKVGIEVVTDSDTGKESLLFCASGLFYYVYSNDNTIIGLLRNYLSKSPVRRQICLEPYRLYHFLQKNNLNCKNVYSLRTAHKVLAKAQKRDYLKNPEQLVKELASRTNIHRLSTHIFTMLHYHKMYQVLESNSFFQEDVQQKEFLILSSIDSLLGIAYNLQEVAETTSSLFTLDAQMDFQFCYQPELKMKNGIYSVTFTLSSGRPINRLVINFLYRFANLDISSKLGYRLLGFTENTFTIATNEKDYSNLCETVANLATYLAEKQEILPLIIIEDIHK